MRSWERLLTYLFCFNSPLRAAWFTCPVATAKATLRASGPYDHIWWRRRFLPMPRDVTRPKIFMLHNQEVWKPRGTISLFSYCRNHCPIASQNVFVVRSLSMSKFIYLFRVHCYSYRHSALLQLSPQCTATVIATVHCYSDRHSALLQSSPQCTATVITTVHCYGYHHSALLHLSPQCNAPVIATVHCYIYRHSALLQLSPQCTATVITTVHCYSYRHSALLRLSPQCTATFIATVHCYSYRHSALLHL